MEIATWHMCRLMLLNHYNSMWTPQPCKCLHHTWAQLYPAQQFKCYYCHHHYQFWHNSVPSTQCPFLRVTEQHWMVSSQDFLGAMEWGHHILSLNLESRKLVCSTAKRKSLEWQNQSIAQCNKTWYIHCYCLWHLILFLLQYACLHQSPELFPE